METQRLLGLDLARGLALISMFVAHTAPWPGLWGYSGGEPFTRGLADNLTVALFAVLIGASLLCAWQRRGRQPTSVFAFLLMSTFRGLLVAICGYVLMPFPSGIAIVLVHLGVLIPVVALLLALPTITRFSIVAVLLVTSQPTLAATAPHVDGSLLTDTTPVTIALNLFSGDDNYRLLSLIPWAVAGAEITRWLLRDPAPRTTRAWLVAAVAGFLTVGLLAADVAGHIDVRPYTGTFPEMAFSGALACTVLGWSFACAHLLGRAGELISWMGAMTLTLYTVQIATTTAWISMFGFDSLRSWASLVTLVLLSLGIAALWRTYRTGRGPLENLIALATTSLTAAVLAAGDTTGSQAAPNQTPDLATREGNDD